MHPGITLSPDGQCISMTEEAKQWIINDTIRLQNIVSELQQKIEEQEAELRENYRIRDELRAKLKKELNEIREMLGFTPTQVSIDAEWYVQMQKTGSVTKTFRILSFKYHPDRTGGSCDLQQRLGELRDSYSLY